MDVGDVRDDNQDIQLYKSSRDLLLEINSQLPSLVKSDGTTRYWLLYNQVEGLANRVSFKLLIYRIED